MKILELFSGTHSIGKVAKDMGFSVVSVDRDLGAECPLDSGYVSDHHIKEDILTWDYKSQFKPNDFYLITASPVCLWWSRLRKSWIGRKCKTINPDGSIVTAEDIERDITNLGKPMVDKIIEIIEYFKPNYYWIENPQTGGMKYYIPEKHPAYSPYYDVDYCKYCDYGYQKKTRFWTNITNFTPKICKNDCDNMIEGQKLHKNRIGSYSHIIEDGKVIHVNTKELRLKYKDTKKIKPVDVRSKPEKRYERYKIPEALIKDLLNSIK